MSDDGAMIRVFLLDDHEVVRRGIAAALEAEGDLSVVGEASTAEEAIAGIREHTPDVAVLDVIAQREGEFDPPACEVRDEAPAQSRHEAGTVL